MPVCPLSCPPPPMPVPRHRLMCCNAYPDVEDFADRTVTASGLTSLGFNCIWLLPLFASPILDDLRRLKRVYSLLLTLPKVGGRAA